MGRLFLQENAYFRMQFRGMESSTRHRDRQPLKEVSFRAHRGDSHGTGGLDTRKADNRMPASRCVLSVEAFEY